MRYSIDRPRESAREIVRNSIDLQAWQQNEAFTRALAEKIRAHRLHHHPIVAAWERGEFTLAGMRFVHAEIRAGFLEVFTESLLRLMQTTAELEVPLGARAKMAARFLILLNVAEELGLKPNAFEGDAGESAEFRGHPAYSHYWQLAETLEALGMPEADWRREPPTEEARATRATLEDNHGDHLRLAAILATIETVFMPYYGPWARNAIAICPALDIPDGYHTIHVEDETGHFVDDEHSEDSWYIVRQALTPDRYAEIERAVLEALETWAGLMDRLVAKNRELKHAA